jgi:predicted ATPase/DNA-binding winged helix-turn-helix (wHTH) protein
MLFESALLATGLARSGTMLAADPLLFQFGEFALDESTFELRRDGVVVPLERRVFDVVAYLIRHRDRVVTKDELLEEVWNQRFLGESAIARAISTARKAIGDPETIKSVYGRGYRWVAPVHVIPVAGTRQISEPPPVRRDTPVPSSVVSSRSTIVGRIRELDSAMLAVEQVLAGRGCVILLSGDPGIGKTRLAVEITERCRTLGMTSVWGRCVDGGGAPPFWPWKEILQALGRRGVPYGRAGGATGSEDGDELLAPGAREPADRFELFARLDARIGEAAQERPLVITIEDLHSADAPSTLLFEFLAERLKSRPILLIGTYRPLELLSDPVRSECIVRTLRKSDPLALELSGLPVEESASLLDRLTGRAHAKDVSELVHRLTAGNPFFVTQLAPLVAANVDPARLASLLPAEVRAACVAQLSGLTSSSRRLLDVAAVLGTRFEIPRLAPAAGCTHADALTMLEPAIRAGLIRAAEAPHGYVFAHELLRDVIYEELPAADRAQFHHVIADVLDKEMRSDDDEHLAALAHHRMRAISIGGEEGAIDAALQAGASCLRRMAYEPAAQYFQSALDTLELSSSSEPATLCAVLMDLATAQLHAGSRSSADASFQRAAIIAREMEASETLVEIALRHAPGLTAGQYNPETHRLRDEALSLLPADDHRSRALLLAHQVNDLFWTDEYAKSAALYEAARADAALTTDPAVHAALANAAFTSLTWPGPLDEKLRITSEAVRLASLTDNLELHETTSVFRLMALLESGSMEAFRQEAAAFRELANRYRLPTLFWVSGVHSAVLAQLEGRIEQVEQAALECQRVGERMSDWSALMTAGALLTVARIEQGRAAEIVDVVRQSVVQFKEVVGWRVLLAYVLLKARRFEDARSVFRDIVTGDFEVPRNVSWPACMAWLAELAFYLDARDAAPSLYDRLLPYTGRFVVLGVAAGCFGSIERHLGLLAAASGRLDLALQHLESGLTANESIGAALPAAYTKLDLATVLARAGAKCDGPRIRALRADVADFAPKMGLAQLACEAIA